MRTTEAILSYAKEKLAITEKMMDEDSGLDYGHSQFLSGTYNAYDDIIFALEHGCLKQIESDNIK